MKTWKQVWDESGNWVLSIHAIYIQETENKVDAINLLCDYVYNN